MKDTDVLLRKNMGFYDKIYIKNGDQITSVANGKGRSIKLQVWPIAFRWTHSSSMKAKNVNASYNITCMCY